MSGFRFGRTSTARLNKAEDALRRVLVRAIGETPQDFSILETLRSTKKQQLAYASGASQLDGINKRSRHQANAAGLAEAVDLAPYLPGLGARYETPLMLVVADAMRKAAHREGVRLRWGGCWGLLRHNRTAANLWASYVKRRLSQGREPFFDPWHFELAR